MSDEDLDELARRYLDLWQDQVSALAADPALGEALRRVVDGGLASAGNLLAAWTAWQGAFATEALRAAAEAGNREAGKRGNDGNRQHAGDGARQHGRDGRSSGETEAGPAPVAAASGGSGGDLDQLARRLAALEQRLGQLERRLDGGRSGDAPRGARRRSKGQAPTG